MAEYKESIEEKQSGKTHEKYLKHTQEKYNGSLCDDYVQCRRQVERSIYRCQMLWNSVKQAPLLSTDTLLEMGDRCISRNDDSFNELYKLAIKRDNKLHGCLDMYHDQVDESMNCSIIATNYTHWYRTFAESDNLQSTTSNADCLAQVNMMQFQCAQLRKCCSNFYRCQNETFDARAELRIVLLTAQLMMQHYDCLRQQMMRMT
ncbi:hypothetical protein LOAG_05416 [Loa loa]|uniref:Uncharacterized protein n=2 Tax=Loa loa TaxID=7209 RepID=A0A1S0U027_LOALO|nr:hypothetical protein LOAG_05416 [Loa loa]EFO23072.2 hypothetical protein LOAG_05416 [Loa loa]